MSHETLSRSLNHPLYALSPVLTVLAPPVPDTPARPTIQHTGKDNFRVAWTAPDDNGAAIDEYLVDWREQGGNWEEVSVTGSPPPTFVDITNLTGQHDLRVSGVGAQHQRLERHLAGAGGGPRSTPTRRTPRRSRP